jgi:hypothetical protein
LPGRPPSISPQGDEDIILNQQGAPQFPKPPSYSRGAEATSSSHQQKLEPSVFFDTFSNGCQQHLTQHRHNQQLYGLIERLIEKLDLVSGQSINARDLLEARLHAPRPTKDENSTATSGQAQGGRSDYSTNDDDDDYERHTTLYVDHTFYRNKIGEGFIQR